MVEFSLEHFTVLLVEDNRYVAKIMSAILRDLSVGNVILARDGVEAIESLKASVDPNERSVDMIISDMVMSPIDGQILLKWVRQGRESPDRFLPFIMMSGAADSETVREARDQGANEFLAKPFSAESVVKLVLKIINQPRQFVATRDYFGPDRHRHIENEIETERRYADEAEATIVYSSDEKVQPKNDPRIYLFRLSNRLRELAGGLSVTEFGELPVKFLEEADKLLDRTAIDFHDWALEYLVKMSGLCTDAKQEDITERLGSFKQINLLAHELRGQGGTFGYPLITHTGKSLYHFTTSPCPVNDDALGIIKAHIDTMRVVFKDKITGDGGETGRALKTSLDQAIRQQGKPADQ
jgi:CheY-like chemotaxis protein